ncbi:hypothetical protein BOX24_06210 [Leptospirillum ferriphilum]|uniref:Resolvase HTH domain-containing protein n=3 Tax=Leptospirillum ferriphilum TaxID=178606 RepID=A0A1V3SVR6_9BACT|nr:hypothetical protein LFML04_0621 [Leptospirillum ferriphilum ML-04]OOH72966.1 hypothetical protein BOX24_06210 [Leptospirillum ferriphilum]
MSEDIQEFFRASGYPDVTFLFDPTVAQACQDLVYDLLVDKKMIGRSRNTHDLLVKAVEKHLDMLPPVQKAVENWLIALFNRPKTEYRLSRELSNDYEGSPRLMSQWLLSAAPPLLFNLVDFLIYVEDDLESAINEKKTKQTLEKIPRFASCSFCWRGVDSPHQYCSHHSRVDHPAVYTRFLAHLKRLGVWVKKSDRATPGSDTPYYRRTGPGLSGGRIYIHRPEEFRWTDPSAPSVIQAEMPKAAMRMEETRCWDALKEGLPNFFEKALVAFDSESRKERDLLIEYPRPTNNVLWNILERYELYSRWWNDHPFPGRGKERSRHSKAREHQVQKYLSEGLSKTEIAKRTGLSRQAIYKIIERIEPKK